MRRFMTTTLIAASVLAGSLSLQGCIVVPPRDHGYVGYHHDHDRGHDHDRRQVFGARRVEDDRGQSYPQVAGEAGDEEHDQVQRREAGSQGQGIHGQGIEQGLSRESGGRGRAR